MEKCLDGREKLGRYVILRFLSFKPIGAKQGILTKQKQNPYENEVGNSQNLFFNAKNGLITQTYRAQTRDFDKT